MYGPVSLVLGVTGIGRGGLGWSVAHPTGHSERCPRTEAEGKM
jgi:hypothetical protein